MIVPCFDLGILLGFVSPTSLDFVHSLVHKYGLDGPYLLKASAEALIEKNEWTMIQVCGEFFKYPIAIDRIGEEPLPDLFRRVTGEHIFTEIVHSTR